MPGRESPNEYIDQYEWGLVVGLDNVEELPILLDQRMNLPDLNWNFKEIKRFWKELFIDTIPCSENEFLSFNPTYILLKDAHNKMVGAYVNGKPTIHIRYKMDFKKRLERIIRKIKEGKDVPIRTTLGPKGMDKMLVSSLGDIIVTNDGATILNEIRIEHPAAKMIVEVAKTQDNEVGDGTTTVAILTGELLKNAERLLDDNIHPTVIIKGYRKASEKAIEILNNIAEDISDSNSYKQIALTAMTGKGAEIAKERLAELTVEAVLQVKEGNEVDLDNIKIEKKSGESVESSE